MDGLHEGLLMGGSDLGGVVVRDPCQRSPISRTGRMAQLTSATADIALCVLTLRGRFAWGVMRSDAGKGLVRYR
jgi:hypothetical protein